MKQDSHLNSALNDYINSLRYRPAYFPEGFFKMVVYPVIVLAGLGVVFNLVYMQWPFALVLALTISGLLIANHMAYQPRYYWLLPLVLAGIPSVVVFVVMVKAPQSALIWAVAIPYFYFTTLHYRRACEFVIVLDLLLVIAVNEQFGSLIALRFALCISLVTALLYKTLSALEANFNKAVDQANLDELTRLPNRRKLNERLTEYVGLKQRYPETEITMAVIDLDYFKKINDELGHQMGDEALCLFAEVLSDRVRQTDLPARYGGEEFALLLPNSSVEVTTAILDDCRAQLQRRPFGDGRVLQFSAGLATLKAGESVDEWMGRCDQALYAAKEQGRNRDITAS